jgi:hypothetical protein
MSFKAALAMALCVAALTATRVIDQPRFFKDDPIWVDDDRAVDAGRVAATRHSEAYDFLDNTFRTAGRVENIKALNVNTLDEVPDSSWFTNRLGRRTMALDEIRRGPETIDPFDVTDWVVVAGKGPLGQQPGFRAVDARDRREKPQLFQLEGDLKQFPELATGAEMIGTYAYHALGYNVVDTYIVHVDPRRVRIAPDATIRDESGRRPFRQADLDGILRALARNPDGTYRMTASRFVEGTPLEGFRYYGTRPDDPNDIHPHEHRRELRGNRVFAAWLNHDDSRGINSLDMLVETNGHRWVKHYMFDFGSILGSTPRRGSGHEYMYDPAVTRRTLATLGLWVPPWQKLSYPDHVPVAVRRFEAEGFEPAGWKPQYPNPAFENMRPDDAFWGAKILASFSGQAIAAVVAKARYSNPESAEHLVHVLIARRDRILRAWLTGVNPITDVSLRSDGTMTFTNAAERAGAAETGTTYRITWARFDNGTNTLSAVSASEMVGEPRATLPSELAGEPWAAVSIRSIHPRYPLWELPVSVFFRREAGGWRTVGLDRAIPAQPVR